jgi:hypothetical protein
LFRPKLESLHAPLSDQMRIVDLLLQNVRVRVCHLQREEQEATHRLLSIATLKQNSLFATNDSSFEGTGAAGLTQFSGLCVRNECDDIIAKYNSEHNIKEEEMQSSVSKIDKEFNDIARMLQERHIMLVKNVQQAAREKIIKLHQQAHMLHEMHSVMFVLRHDHLNQLRIGKQLQFNYTDTCTGGDDTYNTTMMKLVEWTSHSIRKSDFLLQMDIIDEVIFAPFFYYV